MEKQHGIPEWLIKDENYVPQADKDTFINKSILSLLSVLARIRKQSGDHQDKFQVNAAFKVFFTLMLVTLVSISTNFIFVIVINVYLLVILSVMPAQEIVKILRTSFLVAVFTFVILLPAVFWGNGYSSIMIVSKVFATVTAVNILSYSSKWNSITSVLKRFFLPDTFILVLDITLKYIVMLGEFSLDMLFSLKLRSVGNNKSKYTSLSGIAGTMFIKSKEMADDMYAAMECRGFTGEYRINNQLKLKFADFIYITINAGIIFIFVYYGRI